MTFTDNVPDHNIRNLNLALRYGETGLPELRVGTSSAIPVTIDPNTPLPVNMSFGAGQTDAFGRMRTSNPFTLFDSFHRYQDTGKVNEYTAGGGSSTFNSNAGCIEMTVTGSTGSLVYRESSRVFSYQPGKSMLVLQTFCMAAGVAGLRQRQGYFDAASGFYLELDGTTLNLVRRSSVTGTLRETRISQANWNIDTLGAGILNPSGITLDISRVQIFFMDIEWLGVGSVRMGFVINGSYVFVHRFDHANTVGTVASPSYYPYMITACLPVRAEVENTGNTGSSSTYRIICTSVISEGGYELRGRPLTVGHDIAAPYELTVKNTFYPIMSLRLKSTRLGAVVLPKTFSLAVLSQANYQFKLVIGGTTSGGSGWVSAGTNSSVECTLDSTSLSGGTLYDIGYIAASNQTSVSPNLSAYPFQYQLERNTFTGTASEFTILMASDSTTKPKVYAGINWEELT